MLCPSLAHPPKHANVTMVREFRSRRPWREAQGYHAIHEHGGEQGVISLVTFFRRIKKVTSSAAGDVVSICAVTKAACAA